MTLEQVKSTLAGQSIISFILPDGSAVPSHFHVTEVGKVIRHFIDCGGKERKEEIVNFQLWEADDYDHRLHPEKLVSIINLSQQKLGIGDLPVEVEYQGATIGRYDLAHENGSFMLINKATDCLAKDKCELPQENPMVNLSALVTGSSCSPNSGCC